MRYNTLILLSQIRPTSTNDGLYVESWDVEESVCPYIRQILFRPQFLVLALPISGQW